MVFIPYYIYNFFFFCLSHTAEINRMLVPDEFQYPSNDTILRSFLLLYACHSVHQKLLEFLFTATVKLVSSEILYFLLPSSKHKISNSSCHKTQTSCYPRPSQLTEISFMSKLLPACAGTGTQILASGWGFSHKTSLSSNFVSILCREKHQEDDLLSAYL